MKSSRWMKWGILVLALVLCLPTLALAQGGTGGSGGGAINNRGGSASFRANNPVPVLIYTVWSLDDGSGSSGSGGADLTADSPVSTLVIYDNGLAHLEPVGRHGHRQQWLHWQLRRHGSDLELGRE